MAILTTKYTIAWYGVDGETECSNTPISDLLGSYDTSGNYQGPWADRLSDLNSLEIYGYDDGNPLVFKASNMATAAVMPAIHGFTELKCGRMYLIKNFALLPVEIPGLVPSADGVDMGRVVPV